MIKTSFFSVLIVIMQSFVLIGQTTDNVELKKMYNQDQNLRMVENIDWNKLASEDSLRRVRVLELLDSNEVITGMDFFNSAMIFQHGKDSTDYRIAIKLMKKAITLDSTIDKWLLAAAIDRELMSRNQPQIYGTQYRKGKGDNAKWEVYKIDTTIITNEERKQYGVEPVEEFIENVRIMNLLSISEYFSKCNSIDSVVILIKSEIEKGKNSEYNVNEFSINSFGYKLMNLNRLDDALIILKLNTELYPKGANTFDSLGECLFLLNRKEEGLKAYKKSLELNPNNKIAISILKEQE